jgi:cystathionine beta-lyase
VYYPGLPSDPFHEIAKKQMRGFGGMVSFNFVSGKKEDAIDFLKNKTFTLAESLGGVESLANYSVMMAHIDSDKEKKLESPMI